MLFFGLLNMLVATFVFSVLREDVAHGREVETSSYVLVTLVLLLATVQVVSGIFLFRGREWARLVAIVICVLNVIGGLAALVLGGVVQAVVGIVVNIIVIVSLSRGEVIEWFD